MPGRRTPRQRCRLGLEQRQWERGRTMEGTIHTRKDEVCERDPEQGPNSAKSGVCKHHLSKRGFGTHHKRTAVSIGDPAAVRYEACLKLPQEDQRRISGLCVSLLVPRQTMELSHVIHRCQHEARRRQSNLHRRQRWKVQWVLRVALHRRMHPCDQERDACDFEEDGGREYG
jgi:hypothetical protein